MYKLPAIEEISLLGDFRTIAEEREVTSFIKGGIHLFFINNICNNSPTILAIAVFLGEGVCPKHNSTVNKVHQKLSINSFLSITTELSPIL